MTNNSTAGIRQKCDDLKETIGMIIDSLNCRIRNLEEENKKLYDEHFKDKALSEMQSYINEMTDDLNRGFPISKEDYQALSKWQSDHIRDAHNNNWYAGTWEYTFIPTSVGTFGKCICGKCGEKYEWDNN